MESDKLKALVTEFFDSIDFDKSTFVLKTDAKSPEHIEEKAEPCSCSTNKGEVTAEGILRMVDDATTTAVILSSVLVESLSENPEFDMTITKNDHNTFFVREYTAVPDACGTGQIELDDRVSQMNMCEMDNKAVVNLTVSIGGVRVRDVPFILEKTTDTIHMELSADWCNAHLNTDIKGS